MLNKNTRVAVSCYAGDLKQVEQSIGLYTHHECPVTLLSPEDAPVIINYPGVDHKHAGKRGQLGPDAWARHMAFLKILVNDYPEDHFLIHESDSFCLDPKIPAYLYKEPYTVWSNNGVSTPEHWPGFPEGSAKMSFQAPWFFSRQTIKRMIAVEHKVPYHPNLEWVDLLLSRLTEEADLPWKCFEACYLGPMSGGYDVETGRFFDPGSDTGSKTPRGSPLDEHLTKTYELGLNNGLQAVKDRGVNMVHSVKNVIAARALAAEYQKWLSRQNHA